MVQLIHPTAIVGSRAIIGEGVKIGPFTIIHDDVEIGAGTEIGSHCEIGVQAANSEGGSLRIGANSLIRSHSVLYAGSTLGPRLITGHRVTIREGTVAGQNLQVGTLSDIQGRCEFGDFIRLHSNVHVGQFSRVEDFVWIFPYVVLTNDPHPPSDFFLGVRVEKYAVIATSSTVLPGVTVGRDSLVAAHSLVKDDVKAETVVGGVPARVLGPTTSVRFRDGSNRIAYPWRNHFRRGYPPGIFDELS